MPCHRKETWRFGLFVFQALNEVEIIIDVDLANYFGTLDHRLVEEILRKKIKDTKFLRYGTVNKVIFVLLRSIYIEE